MAVPTWNPGQILTASDVNTWLADDIAFKAAAQHYSGTTLANDSALVLPMSANASYLVTCFVYYDGGTLAGSDLKVNVTLPTGASYALYVSGYNTGNVDLGGNAYGSGATPALPVTLGTSGAGNGRGALITGSATTTATAGNFQLQFAQGTSNATDSIVHIGSFLQLTRAA